jgi:hypothetical protein
MILTEHRIQREAMSDLLATAKRTLQTYQTASGADESVRHLYVFFGDNALEL